MASLREALAFLAADDAAGLTSAEQAECLRGLEAAESALTAARASMLTAFTAGRGFEDDGHGSARTWLKWQARVTAGAAAGAVGWMRRLAAHPAVREALADGQVSASWARQLCAWTEVLPEEVRLDADVILLAAAAAGVDLAGLASLAAEIRARTARPDREDDDGFEDRSLRLETTLAGAGRLDGDLTPQCAAALRAVLDVLGKRAGPEDLRTKRQREHDALEEACRRLIAAGGLPDRAGQPVQIQLHMTLDDLLRRSGSHAGGGDTQAGAPGTDHDAGPGAESPGQTAARAEPGWTAAPPGAECDAQFVPIVTGRIDRRVLDDLAWDLAHRTDPDTGAGGRSTEPRPEGSSQPGPVGQSKPTGPAQPGPAGAARPGPTRTAQPGAAGSDPPGPAGARAARAGHAARDLILDRAMRLLSGPGGLAAALRSRQPGDLGSTVSLPLDIGAVSDTIPVHLRRAVIARDRHCRFPGCDQPPVACHPHHLTPRARGGPTSLGNLLLLCSFHHLTAVHRWGWVVRLRPDGIVSATSPDRARTYYSHGPPSPAAA